MRRYFKKLIKKDHNRIISFLVVFIFIISVFVSNFLNADAVFNKEINYQGKLTLASGVAVPNTSYSIVFSLYTVSSGGSPIWTETRSVTTSNGLFSEMLGSSQSLASVDFNQTLYLGVKVGSDAEMTPRKKLGMVPAAMEAGLLGGHDASYFATASGYVPYTGATSDISLGSHNITMTGSLADTTNRVTKGWFSDIETNDLKVDGTFSQTASSTYGIENNLTQTAGSGTHTTQGIRNTTTYSGSNDEYKVYGIANAVTSTSTNKISNLIGAGNWIFNDAGGEATSIWGDTTNISNAGKFNKLTGVSSYVTNTSTNVLNNDLYGVYTMLTNSGVGDGYAAFDVDATNTGTLTDMHGLQIDFYTAGGTTGTLIGIDLGNTHNWTGTPTNSYGIYIDSTTNIGTSTNYAIFSESTASTYFAGNLGIKNTTPTELLTLGTSGTTAGTLSLAGLTSGKAIIQVSAIAGTPTLTLPTTTGTLALTSDISTSLASYVPYTGATTNVNLGSHNLTVDTDSLFVDAINHKVGIGTTSPQSVLDVDGTIYTKGPWADVKAFGAKGDGITDDTIAVQAAFTASKNVYFPSGTYIIDSVNIINDGTYIHGDGYTSVIKFKTGETGTMLSAGTNKIFIEKIRLTGGVASDYMTVSSMSADRSGLSLMSDKNSIVTNMTIDGFENTGLLVTNTGTTSMIDRFLVANIVLKNNWIGIETGLDGENYTRYFNLDISRCRYGFMAGEGNVNLGGSNLYKNYYAIYIDGTRLNDGHGNINNNLINHNTNPIYITDVGSGYTIIGNNIFEGTISLINSTGVTISNGTIDVTEFILSGGGKNWIIDNHAKTHYGNTITHNYGGLADDTTFVNNYYDDGTFVESRSTPYLLNNRLGIGQTNPQYPIDLNIGTTSDTSSINLGTYNLAGNVGGGVLWKSNYTGVTKISAGIKQMGEGSYFRSGIGFFTGNNSDYTTDAVERMRINMNGYVGIGTTEPAYKLHIAGADPQIFFDDTDGGSPKDFSIGTNVMGFQIKYAGSADVLTIQGGGNVGIGTTTPRGLLDVAGTMYLGSQTTDAAKPNYIVGSQYDTTNEPEGFFMLGGFSNATNNYTSIGGGSGTYNSSNAVRIYTAENNTTRTGSLRMYVAGNGNIALGGLATPTALTQVYQWTAGTGTIDTTASGTTVTGTGTQFLNTFKVGDTITANGETHTISAIASNTSMTTDAWTGANTGVTYTLVGGTRLAVLGNGNVGIGTTSPATKLHLSDTTGVTMRLGSTKNDSDWNNQDFGVLDFYSADTSTPVATSRAQISASPQVDNVYGQGGDLVFRVSDITTGSVLSEQMRLKGNGYLQVGPTSANKSGYIHLKSRTPTMTYTAWRDTGTSFAFSLMDAKFQNDVTTADLIKISLLGSNNIGGTPALSYLSIGNDYNDTSMRVYADKTVTFDSNVRIGGTTTPTAGLNLSTGTATAGTAPLKFTSGTNLTTAETGAMEYDGTDLYFTPSGTTRETIAYVSDITSSLTSYVPYTGATTNVDLGNYGLYVDKIDIQSPSNQLIFAKRTDVFDFVKYYVASAWTDITSEAGRSKGTVSGDILDVIGNTFVIGKTTQFSNIYIDIGTALGGTVSSPVLVWEYSTGSGSWSTLSVTDNTATTYTLAQDGNVSFTPPGDWATDSQDSSAQLYFVRLRVVSGTFSTEPTIYLAIPNDGNVKSVEMYANGNDTNASFFIDAQGNTRLGETGALTTMGGALNMSGALAGATTGAFSSTVTMTYSQSTLASALNESYGFGITNSTTYPATALIPQENSLGYNLQGEAWDGSASKTNGMNLYLKPYSDTITGSRLVFRNTFVDDVADNQELMSLSNTGALEVLGSTLGSEVLNNGAISSATYWNVTGDWAYSTSDYTFTYATGSGTLYQNSSDFSTPLKPNTWYRFSYTVGVAGPTGTLAWIGTEVANKKSYFTTSTTEIPIYFKTNASPGNFTIYTTANATSGFRLDDVSLKEVSGGSINTYGNITTSGSIGIGNVSPSYALHVGSSSVTDGTVLLRLQDSNSTCDFTANTGAPSCGSDITLKKNIEDQKNNLEKVLALRPVTYNWLTDEEGVSAMHGFIAQEVAEVMPELVTDGVWVDGSTRKFLQTAGMTPYIIGAIKEMNLKIEGINNFEIDEQGNSVINTWRDALVSWFANTTNGIGEFVGGILRAKDKLCIGEGSDEVCITKEELLQMKSNSLGSAGNAITETPVEENTPTGGSENVPDSSNSDVGENTETQTTEGIGETKTQSNSDTSTTTENTITPSSSDSETNGAQNTEQNTTTATSTTE